MSDSSKYSVPSARHRVEQSIDRSRFICTLQRAEEPEAAQALIREINEEFPDASHSCWAYIAGPPGSTGAIGMSDAGEPHGTAGRPMLTVLLHSGVGEIAAVVTRYYGGIKLGMGGLARAYSGTVQLALESLPLSVRVEYVDVFVSIGYSSVAAVQQAISRFEVEVVQEEYGADVRYTLRVPRSDLDVFRAVVADATRGSGEFRIDG